MSVLIEAVCLVVPRLVLDVSYPGGTDAFLAVALLRDGVRFAIADDHLASISAFEPDMLFPLIDELMEQGVVWIEDRRAYECVIVDQETGLSMPCDWLQMARHPHGFALAWQMPGEPSDLTTPDDWRLERSWRLTRTDVRDGNDDWMRLAADEDGTETWIDFSTGQMQQALAEEPRVLVVEPESDALKRVPTLGRAMTDVRTILAGAEMPYAVDLEHRCVVIPFTTEDVDRVQLMVTAIAGGEALRCDAVLPDRIPIEEIRLVRQVAAALTAAGSDCALSVDADTRSAHVTLSITPRVDDDRLKLVERGLCRAADQAGRVHAAIARARSGEESIAECVRGTATA